VKSNGPQTEMTADANRLRFIPSMAEGDMAVVVGEPIRVGDADVEHDRSDFRILRKL
jgi:hypothetical protein